MAGLKEVYTKDGRNVFRLRGSPSEKVLNVNEYVGMVADVLKLQKNVCLCRHFHNLDKKLVSK